MPVSREKETVKILIAEDDDINREVIGAFLRNVPAFQLTMVKDGRAALEAANATRFDVMILDQNMPFITGDRLIRYLRASDSPNAQTPAIRLSADTIHAAQHSMVGVKTVSLPKPLRRDELVSAIWAVIVSRSH